MHRHSRSPKEFSALVPTPVWSRFMVAASLCAGLAACGGGGGQTPAPPPPAPGNGEGCPNSTTIRLIADNAPTAGRSVEAAVGGCSVALIRDPVWTQTSGPAVSLLSHRSQAISFIPNTAGSYGFRMDYKNSSGQAQSQAVSFSVSPASNAVIAIRGEPSVFSGGSASLRAWPNLPAGDSVASITWAQTAGPAATVDTSNTDTSRVIFTAPSSSGDVAVTFRATMTSTKGLQDTDEFTVLVQGLPGAPAYQLFRDYYSATRVYPYLANGPHAQALAECVYTPALTYGNNTNLCTMQRLPLLGQETNGALPSVDQVMNRVLVSNDWMGEVFRQFLLTHDGNGDMRRMLNATTAIVIGGRVRPSFYWSTTGAIYLDAGYFWSTAEQRDTVTEVPDYRSAFGQDLKFFTPYRYVVGNNYASASYPITQRGTRPVEAMISEAGRLMYHELTHANDFINPSIQTGLSRNLRVEQAVPASVTSTRLFVNHPYLSQEMLGLARVMFHGVAANATQLAYQPGDVSTFFKNDRVTDDYAYSVPPSVNPPVSYEDTAMLMEEFWMSYRHGIRRDWAVTNAYQSGMTAQDLIVNWGQRGRIGAPEIRTRLKLVSQELAPWLSSSAVDSLPPPIQMTAGADWLANLNLSSPGTVRATVFSAQTQSVAQEQLHQVQSERARQGKRPPTGHHHPH
jgi:hypothetical protein